MGTTGHHCKIVQDSEDVHTFVGEGAFCTLGALCGNKISSSRKLGDVDKLSPAIVQLKS